MDKPNKINPKKYKWVKSHYKNINGRKIKVRAYLKQKKDKNGLIPL